MSRSLSSLPMIMFLTVCAIAAANLPKNKPNNYYLPPLVTKPARVEDMVCRNLDVSLVAAPEDPPVYGPCAPMNPLTQYIPFDHNGLLWSWQCYLAYKAELQGQIVAYWARIARCDAWDCACYKAEWEQFERNMREAEIQLVECGQNPEE